LEAGRDEKVRAELGIGRHIFIPLPHRQTQRADVLMGEVVNVLVAFAVIVFIFRWVTSGMFTLLS
jgi:hypothetical protein